MFLPKRGSVPSGAAAAGLFGHCRAIADVRHILPVRTAAAGVRCALPCAGIACQPSRKAAACPTSLSEIGHDAAASIRALTDTARRTGAWNSAARIDVGPDRRRDGGVPRLGPGASSDGPAAWTVRVAAGHPGAFHAVGQARRPRCRHATSRGRASSSLRRAVTAHGAGPPAARHRQRLAAIPGVGETRRETSRRHTGPARSRRSDARANTHRRVDAEVAATCGTPTCRAWG